MEIIDCKKSEQLPNGGWGWVIVFSSFLLGFICHGFIFTIGVFYEEFLQVYQEGEVVTSIFYSLMTGMFMLVAPFASGLTHAYGCRNVAVGGAILATSGMLSSVILDYNMYCHAVTLGLVCGEFHHVCHTTLCCFKISYKIPWFISF